jgi:Transposase DDE domain
MSIVQTVTTSLQRLLGSALDELARSCGLIARERKFTGQTLLKTIVLTLLHKPDATWSDFHLTATQLGLHLSVTAVKNRFAAGEPLVDFFKQAFQLALRHLVAAEPANAALFACFHAVFLGDATTLHLPAELADLFPGCGGDAHTSRAALKVQVLWDLKTGQLQQMEIEAGKAADALSPIALAEAPERTLLVYDLGYFDIERFAALDRQKAKFISRLQFGTKVLEPEQQSVIDLAAYLQAQPALVDRAILLGLAVGLACRLIAVRVPEELVNQRRRKARARAKDNGREPSAAYLELLSWTMFVTNCTAEELTWKAVVVLYRARWQVELLFKLWKSHNGLARYRAGASAQERLALIYAKLLAVVLQHWLLLATCWHIRDRSLRKAATVLQEQVKALLLALFDEQRLQELFCELRRLMDQLAHVKGRKDNPSHAQLLANPELLDWLA